MVSWPKAVLLDLDDTILAFDSVSDASWMTVCDRSASRLEALGVDDVFSSIKAAAHRQTCNVMIFPNPTLTKETSSQTCIR